MKHKDVREVSAGVRSLWGHFGGTTVTDNPELSLLFQVATTFCLEAGRDLLPADEIIALRRIEAALLYRRAEANTP